MQSNQDDFQSKSSTMATVSTTVTPTTPEFHFPLPASNTNNNSNNKTGVAGTSAANNNPRHSRQFTGIALSKETSARLEPLAPPALPKPNPSIHVDSAAAASPPRSPHRRHAHKRSGAVSQHDITLDGFADFYNHSNDSGSKMGSALLPSSSNHSTGVAAGSATSSPSLNFASSSTSSLPLPSAFSCSTTSSPSSVNESTNTSAKTRVSFVETPASSSPKPPQARPRNLQGGADKPRPTSLVSVASEPPHSSYKYKQKKHKRVKSWAGSLFRPKRHQQKSQQDKHKSPQEQEQIQDASSQQQQQQQPQLHSSSYIPALNLIKVTHTDSSDSESIDEEPEPIIDLDDATYDPTMIKKHQRSESAPDFAFGGATASRGMKRKMGLLAEESSSDSIIEEEEPEDSEDDSHTNNQASAASSTVSLNSTASSITNRDRGRYSRSYNTGLLALGLLRPNQEIISKNADYQHESESDEDDQHDDTLEQPQPASHQSTITSISNLQGQTDEEKRLSATISSSGTITPPAGSKRLSLTGTITDSQKHRFSVLSVDEEPDEEEDSTSVIDDMGSFSLGEPGPEVHSTPGAGNSTTKASTKPPTEASIAQSPRRRSFLKLRRESATSTATSLENMFLSNSNTSIMMKRRSLPTRMWGWVRGKVSTSSLNQDSQHQQGAQH